MKPLLSFLFFGVLLFSKLHSHIIPSLDCEQLGNIIYVVHATNRLPLDGVLRAGIGEAANQDIYPNNIRMTIHFALGELVRPVGDNWMNWEESRYAVVVPLESLYPPLVNINCYDTFILDDFVMKITNSFQQFGSDFEIEGVKLGNNGIRGALNFSSNNYGCVTIYGTLTGEKWEHWSDYGVDLGINVRW